MIVHDFDIVSVAVAPDKADAVLIVDPYAVLAFAVAMQQLKAIAWRHFQISQVRRIVYHDEFSQRDPP